MHTTTSSDGTRIAFERLGDGPPVILVSAALHDRAGSRPLADLLQAHLSVVIYDRRGRGDSGDATTYDPGREIDDLRAIIAEVGGSACVYGHSSGAALVLHAAANGLPITRFVLHEPPFEPDDDHMRRQSAESAAAIEALLAQDRRSDAVALMMEGTGMPPEMLDDMRQQPWWTTMETLAHTLPYDFELMTQQSRGGLTPAEQAAQVSVPGLVLCGGRSPDWMTEVGRAVADALPHGHHRILEGHGHDLPPEVLAPVLVEFFTGQPGA